MHGRRGETIEQRCDKGARMNQTHWPLLAFTLVALAAMVIPVVRTRARPAVKAPGNLIHQSVMADEASDEWMSEAEEKRWIEERDAANAAWRARWPNHCPACRGWGGATHYESHGFRHGTAEQIFDLCDAIPETQCHRCGEHGLTEEGDGPCVRCGWNFDDGLQQ